MSTSGVLNRARLRRVDLDKLLDPSGYLGAGEAFIDAALQRHSTGTGPT